MPDFDPNEPESDVANPVAIAAGDVPVFEDVQELVPPPSIADGIERSLDPRSITASRIAAGIWLAIFTLPTAFVPMVLMFVDRAGVRAFAALGLWGGVTGALAIWSLWWPALRYRYASYRLEERGMWIRRGVWWRSEISVPRSRIQHTDVSQGPLERPFGIATLILHTAGVQYAAVSLSGLPKDTAFAIRDYLLEGGLDDAV